MRRLLALVVVFAALSLALGLFVELPRTEDTVGNIEEARPLLLPHELELIANLSYRPGMAIFVGKDNSTKGRWMNTYGSYAHILPDPPVKQIPIPVGNFSTPEMNSTFADYGWSTPQIAGLAYYKALPPYWDEYQSLSPSINYTLHGTLLRRGDKLIQYPVFEWSWSERLAERDSRAVSSLTDSRKWLACWFDGGERGFPSRSYLNMTLQFPDGFFILSLYFCDVERTGRTGQEIYLTNGSIILTHVRIEGAEFDEGIYAKFAVAGPMRLTIHIVKDKDSSNAVLSGVFVDRVDR